MSLCYMCKCLTLEANITGLSDMTLKKKVLCHSRHKNELSLLKVSCHSRHNNELSLLKVPCHSRHNNELSLLKVPYHSGYYNEVSLLWSLVPHAVKICGTSPTVSNVLICMSESKDTLKKFLEY